VVRVTTTVTTAHTRVTSVHGRHGARGSIDLASISIRPTLIGVVTFARVDINVLRPAWQRHSPTNGFVPLEFVVELRHDFKVAACLRWRSRCTSSVFEIRTKFVVGGFIPVLRVTHGRSGE
jgi:hypothetical protein